MGLLDGIAARLVLPAELAVSKPEAVKHYIAWMVSLAGFGLLAALLVAAALLWLGKLAHGRGWRRLHSLLRNRALLTTAFVVTAMTTVIFLAVETPERATVLLQEARLGVVLDRRGEIRINVQVGREVIPLHFRAPQQLAAGCYQLAVGPDKSKLFLVSRDGRALEAVPARPLTSFARAVLERLLRRPDIELCLTPNATQASTVLNEGSAAVRKGVREPTNRRAHNPLIAFLATEGWGGSLFLVMVLFTAFFIFLVVAYVIGQAIATVYGDPGKEPVVRRALVLFWVLVLLTILLVGARLGRTLKEAGTLLETAPLEVLLYQTGELHVRPLIGVGLAPVVFAQKGTFEAGCYRMELLSDGTRIRLVRDGGRVVDLTLEHGFTTSLVQEALAKRLRELGGLVLCLRPSRLWTRAILPATRAP